VSRSVGERQKDPSSALARLGYLFPKTIDLSLHRIGTLLSALKKPHCHLPPVIHVAGTNGKGSTIAFLRSILEASGRTVHVYTSPHLVNFNERIRIAGKLIDDEELTDLLDEVELANAGRPITFFEATTVAAFLAFSRHRADFTIIETGMGGRLDATNVVPAPAITAITPISLDHTSYLGSTVSAIAREKAGIFRKGVPVAIGPQCKEARDALEASAAKISAPRFDYGPDWSVEATDNRLFYSGRRQLILPRPPLAGDHQLANAGLALAILDLLPNLRLTPADYMRGILNAEWPARLMVMPHDLFDDLLPHGMEVLLDGGHNAGAAQALATWADALDGELDLIVGMLNTKSPRDFLEPLSPYVRRLRGVAIDGNDQSHSSNAIVAAAREAGIADARSATSVLAALAGLSLGTVPRRILICGSLHLAGRFLSDLTSSPT
jgi:dihydrofolate synthase/folylpolyglutamate synthase